MKTSLLVLSSFLLPTLGLAAACSSPSDASSAPIEEALFPGGGGTCLACQFPPDPPPIIRKGVSLCGPLGVGLTSIVHFGVGQLKDSTQNTTAKWGETYVFQWALSIPGFSGTHVDGLTLDGMDMSQYAAEARADGLVYGAWTDPKEVFTSSTPRVHTLVLQNDDCGPSTQTLTIQPVQVTPPDYHFTLTPTAVLAGQPTIIEWYLNPFSETTCWPATIRLDAALANRSAPGTGVNLFSLPEPASGQLPSAPTQAVDYTITATCSSNPAAVSKKTVTLEMLHVVPTIDSFTVAPTDNDPTGKYGYVYFGDAATFTWKTTAPGCQKLDVSLTATSYDTKAIVKEVHHLPANGSVSLKPSEKSTWTLNAKCLDSNFTAAPQDVWMGVFYTPQKPKPPAESGTKYCVRIINKIDGSCRVEGVLTSNPSTAESEAEETYSPSDYTLKSLPHCDDATMETGCNCTPRDPSLPPPTTPDPNEC